MPIKQRRYDDKLPGCAMEATLNLIGGKWKGVILHHLLLDGTQRFNVLRRKLDGVTQTMLVKQLRELEDGGLVHREVLPGNPPKVEYSLTGEGRGLESILTALNDWGARWIAQQPSKRIRQIPRRAGQGTAHPAARSGD